MVRTYLEWLVNLPWAISTEDNLDIPHARQVLAREVAARVELRQGELRHGRPGKQPGCDHPDGGAEEPCRRLR
jgi:ATP-dependent Lon protease